MTQPQKIRVLYFDESMGTMQKFIDLCTERDIIRLVGAFRSLEQTCPALEADGYRFLELLDPDVIVVKISDPAEESRSWLAELKKHCRGRLVGLLSERCAADREIVRSFDYFTAEGYKSDEDKYTHLMYQIKSARLSLNNEKAGVKGKWAILPLPPKAEGAEKVKLIAMGASAGGTEALAKVLSALPQDMPPILVVQHIPVNFTQFFADNLASKVKLRVTVAVGGERLENGTVYIAGNDRHMEVTRSENGDYYIKCSHRDKVHGHRPSVDVLFMSAARAAGVSAVGVILTGMGSDGAQGLLEMREAGAYTIGQDEESSVVYGMPMVAYTIGAVKKQLPLDDIPQEIISASTGEKNGK